MAPVTKSAAESSGYFNGYRVSAWIAHAGSWLTTYWLVEWIGDPKTDTGRALVVLVAIAVEFTLHKMKKLLFDEHKHNDGVGWAGFIIDSIVNAGGAFPKAGRFAAWPPLVALVGAFGVDSSKGPGNTVAAFILALVGGTILSVLPIRLSRAADEASN
jgi:hypothetical protein